MCVHRMLTSIKHKVAKRHKIKHKVAEIFFLYKTIEYIEVEHHLRCRQPTCASLGTACRCASLPLGKWTGRTAPLDEQAAQALPVLSGIPSAESNAAPSVTKAVAYTRHG